MKIVQYVDVIFFESPNGCSSNSGSVIGMCNHAFV